MRVVVAGLVNLETVLLVEGFPLTYEPVRYPFHGITSGVSGVGTNLSMALRRLGHDVRLLARLGDDAAGHLARRTLSEAGLSEEGLLGDLTATPQSVILVDPAGRRAVNVDLKDLQEQHFPLENFRSAARGARWALLCNLNMNRPLLAEAQELGLSVATDVHAIADLDDAYNRDFMAAADVLFMSHERLPCAPEDWATQVLERFAPRILVIGLGGEGALLAWPEGGVLQRFPSVFTRKVVNTVGAGDALFSGFLHALDTGRDPVAALALAQTFASYKIGEHGGACGFLDAVALGRVHSGEGGTPS